MLKPEKRIPDIVSQFQTGNRASDDVLGDSTHDFEGRRVGGDPSVHYRFGGFTGAGGRVERRNH